MFIPLSEAATRFATKFKVSSDTFRRRVLAGDVKHARVGKQIMVDESDLARLMAQLEGDV